MNRRKMENSRKCDINVNVHRASFVKHLSKTQLENEKQNGMIRPERLLTEEQAPIKKQIKRMFMILKFYNN